MPVAVADFVDACPAFAALERGVAEQVAAISRIVEVAKDTLLCRQGAEPDAVHYLLDGQVVLSQSAADGLSAVIEIVEPVTSIALAGVVADQPHAMSAHALKPSRLLQIPAPPLRQLVATRPRLAVAFLQGLSLEFHSATRQVLDLKLRTSSQRLGCFLLSLVPEPTRVPVSLRLPYQKRLLAARLGCRYENLSRAFAVLRDYGVETHGSRVIMRDLEALREFSVPEPAAESPLPLSSAAEAFSRAFQF